jgi:tetratricopeptide (TPR) repeat protein
MRGDLQGALASYRKAIAQLGRAGQNVPAEGFLEQFAVLSVMLGQSSAALTYAQQQKLDGEELQAIALLQTLSGNSSAGEQSLKRFAETHPAVAPGPIEQRQAVNEIFAAVLRNDGQAALTRAATIPNFQNPPFLLIKGRAHVLVNDYSSAETELRRALLLSHNQANLRLMTARFPVVEMLCHYYLGQVYERSGKRDQAINEYQEFLSHFQSSNPPLPQIAEARSTLKRLMQ